MYSILRGPDSFRFRPPKEQRWLHPLFWLTNIYLLRRKHRCAKLDISKKSMGNLRAITGGDSHLVIANHTNYADAHVLWEVLRAAKAPSRWMAGIDLFDRGKGIFGFYFQSNGTFSVDRGIVDVHAIAMARSTLRAGKYPLIVFPEGEANYTNDRVAPFYNGAASFALSTVQSTPVHVTPIAIRYALLEGADAFVQEAFADFGTRIGQAALERGIAFRVSDFNVEEGDWGGVRKTIDNAVSYMENVYSLSIGSADDLEVRTVALRDHILETLCAEHAPKLMRETYSYEEVMSLKNRLWSIIARKLHAPNASKLRAIVQEVEGASESLLSSHLDRWEEQYIGITCEGAIEHRKKRLLRHLRTQEPYAAWRTEASEGDCLRWQSQLVECRGAKMLTLLGEHLERRSATWEAIDETLSILDILVFTRFRNRGPLEAIVEVGGPMAVHEFVARNEHMTKQERVTALTQHFHATISGMLLNGKAASQER